MSEMLEKKQRAEEIITEHADMIYRIALQNLKNDADAQDIFQEVCLSLLTNDAPLYDDVYIKHWLIRVTINKCNNFRKSLWQSKTQAIDENTKVATGCDIELIDEVFSLPATYRNIIYLYYFEGYTVPQIAQILQKSKNTVNSQLQRARKKLRKILEEGEIL